MKHVVPFTLFGLAACSAGESVTISEDMLAAASTCSAVVSLYERQNNGVDDPITLDQYSATFAISMAAVAEITPFDANTLTKVVAGTQAEMERVATRDWRGAVQPCYEKFHYLDSSRLVLPADDLRAAGACFTVASFIGDALRSEAPHLATDVARFDALAKRAEAIADEPANSVGLSDAAFKEKVAESAKIGFGSGNPAGFLGKCEARFPG